MSRITDYRPSPAMAVAFAALFVAGTGSGIAATSLLTGKQIKDASLTGADVKDGSLTLKDFKVAPKGPAGPAGATGATGATGAPGAAGAAGAKGDIGPSNAFQAARTTGLGGQPATTTGPVTYVTLALQPGAYALSATATIGNLGAVANNAACELVAGTDISESRVGIVASGHGTFTMQVNHTFAAAGSATIRCTAPNASYNFNFGQITAIQVATATRTIVTS